MQERLTLPWLGSEIELTWFTLMEAGVLVLLIVYVVGEIIRWGRR